MKQPKRGWVVYCPKCKKDFETFEEYEKYHETKCEGINDYK